MNLNGTYMLLLLVLADDVHVQDKNTNATKKNTKK
jgi:hypothetical protein